MAKSIKLKGDRYWDKSAITTNKKGASLANLFFSDVVGTPYEVGDIVIFNTGVRGQEHYKLYVCIQTHTSSSSIDPRNTNYWAPVFNVA